MSKAALVACLACSLAIGSLRAADDPLVGKKVDGFTLRDFHGASHTLAQYESKKLMVLAFLGAECPLAQLYAGRLAEMSREYADRGVIFLGIDANLHDTPTKLAAYAKSHALDFPLLVDAGNTFADQIGATRTPEVFVLDEKRVVRYHGRIDDQYLVGAQREKVSRRDLSVAIDELLAGKEVSQPTSPFTGCLIAKVSKFEPRGDITYSRHVAAIVNRHCVECHREGELAPFPLTSYDDVAAWAATIREVVDANRMPPWLADSRYGKFSNDCSMSEDKKKTLFTWIDNGCPEGNPAEAPSPPVFTTGWRMGQPDLVFRMPEAYAVPAEGTVDYQYFACEPKVKEDIWVSVAEARADKVSVVHHVVLFAVPPQVTLRHLQEAQGLGKMVAIYAPGMNPWRYPEGTAMKIEAGSTLVIQMHYTPKGTPMDDRSYVGLKLADPAKVKREVRYGMAVNNSFELAPGSDNTVVESRKLFLKDSLVMNLFPHMHYRGKSFRFEAEYPDGRREVLLDVPHYDFNWQLRYDLAEPKLMPKGSRLICTARFDNSAENLLNPDPTQTVRFGLQTWEEMMVGYYTTVRPDENLAAQND